MNGIIFALSFAFVVIPTILFPSTHKVLRKQKEFKYILFFTISLPIFSILLLIFDPDEIENHNSFMSLSPLFFVLLYKYYDNIILRKYGRHIYFFVRNNHVLYSDDESDESTSLELWLKLSLSIFPFLLSALINFIILDLIYKYLF
jgi:hypothetical protein